MTDLILGIDTSCYQTSCAAVDLSGSLLAEYRKMLSVPEQQRGLRQSEAVFQHIRQLPEVLETLFCQLDNSRILAVCASDRPVNQEASYMPVFLAGASFARSIASTHRIPYYATSHQEGHFAAASMEVSKLPAVHLAVHLSGGTTELLLIRPEEVILLGGTKDISAGQLLDRMGVKMGYDFPAGAAMEALARKGWAEARYPAVVQGLGLSFSGCEAAAMRDLDQGKIEPEHIAAELFDSIVRSLSKWLESACEQTKVYDVLLTGGVASSLLLRESLDARLSKRSRHIKTYYGLPKYAGDNAVGVALIGLQNLIKENKNGHCTERERTF